MIEWLIDWLIISIYIQQTLKAVLLCSYLVKMYLQEYSYIKILYNCSKFQSKKAGNGSFPTAEIELVFTPSPIHGRRFDCLIQLLAVSKRYQLQVFVKLVKSNFIFPKIEIKSIILEKAQYVVVSQSGSYDNFQKKENIFGKYLQLHFLPSFGSPLSSLFLRLFQKSQSIIPKPTVVKAVGIAICRGREITVCLPKSYKFCPTVKRYPLIINTIPVHIFFVNS